MLGVGTRSLGGEQCTCARDLVGLPLLELGPYLSSTLYESILPDSWQIIAAMRWPCAAIVYEFAYPPQFRFHIYIGEVGSTFSLVGKATKREREKNIIHRVFGTNKPDNGLEPNSFLTQTITTRCIVPNQPNPLIIHRDPNQLNPYDTSTQTNTTHFPYMGSAHFPSPCPTHLVQPFTL